MWCFKKSGKQSIGKSVSGYTSKITMVSYNESRALDFILSPGNLYDALEGRLMLETLGRQKHTLTLIADKGYSYNETIFTATSLGFNTVIPPKSNRILPWHYDKELYKSRNEIERLFRKLKAFRRIYTRYDKLDAIFISFIHLALIFMLLK